MDVAIGRYLRDYAKKKKNVLYVTVNLPDIQESTLVYDLTPTSISVKAKSGE